VAVDSAIQHWQEQIKGALAQGKRLRIRVISQLLVQQKLTLRLLIQLVLKEVLKQLQKKWILL